MMDTSAADAAESRVTARSPGSVIPLDGDDGKRWRLRWYVGKDHSTGKRQYASEIFTGTAAAARKALAKKTVSVDEGTIVIPTNQTVAQYLYWWLEHVAKREVTVVTHESYKNRVKSITAKLGSLKLRKLDWQIVQQFYNQLRDSGLGGKGLGGRTIRYTHTILKAALQHAVRGRLLNDNPCTHASPGAHDKQEMMVWSKDEVQLFLERTREDRDYALWYTLLHTGLRPGEALGLKWTDLKDEKLQIVRAVAEIDAKTNRIEDVKTPAGRRSMTLTRENLEVLQAHRKSQLEEVLKAGPEYLRKDFIFARSTGEHDLVLRVRKRWKRAVARVNGVVAEEKQGSEAQLLPQIRLYDCRHTHATLLLHAGVHPKVVQERLGHASIKITLDTYSHVVPSMQDEAVEKLRVLMNGG